ncbi:RHS repeat protein [Undibacterium pigrum]|uniref:YD repeat-containing protein n=1 Tax=Undibacterium pigrum TaxID=401470 RepID=A0A318JDN5_9BURK|nr:YD repeat-containing protein [Undibacterium pigrum]
MVAMVNGQGLGAQTNPLNVFAQRSQLGHAQAGKNGQRVCVNGKTGNLVIQSQDVQLFDHGLDLGVLRTYNSSGQFTDDNGDNWLLGFYAKRLDVVGPLGKAGSSLIKTEADGARVSFQWDDAHQKYTGQREGEQPADILLDGGQLLWRQQGTGLSESYDIGSGRLLATIDPLAYRISYDYDDRGLLAKATSDHGASTSYQYDGNRLRDIQTHYLDTAGQWQQQNSVHYSYDGQDRLSAVTLTTVAPDGANTAAGHVYSTRYTYDGNSKRLAGISQDDGTQLSFTYQEIAGEYRLSQIEDGQQQTTRFAYDIGNGITTVEDSLHQHTVLSYRADGKLIAIDQPQGQGSSHTDLNYDDQGNLLTVIADNQLLSELQYDAAGRQISGRDADGNTLTRTYDSLGQLRSETIQLSADGSNPAQPASDATTRYYYQAAPSGRGELLRFIIDATGQATEYRYNAQGQRISALSYTAQSLDAASLTGDETVATIDSLVQNVVQLSDAQSQSAFRTDILRTDLNYDAHGQLASVIHYTQVHNDASFSGDAQSQAETRYLYDTEGRLLTKIDLASALQTTYTHDEQGRVLSVTEGPLASTVNQHEPGARRLSITNAAGVQTTQIYGRTAPLMARHLSSASPNSQTRPRSEKKSLPNSTHQKSIFRN